MTDTLTTSPASTRAGIDPRGPRFGAAVTTVVLAVTLATITSPVAGALLAAQALVFAMGTFVGISAQPYGVLFRRVVRPRLGNPSHLEDPAPPRFAQAVGLAFVLVALMGWTVGATPLAAVATAFALIAAFLNAVFGLCLGCEMYLLGRRLTTR